MKLIDKYLLREYLVPFFCCLFGFCLIYIISGLFDKASDFMRAGLTLGQIVYFYGLFLLAYADQSNVSFLVTILPISLLASALYSLSRLTRQNELTAMCSSGISIVRLMVPFLGVGIACSVIALVVQEVVAPRASRLTDQFLAENGKPVVSPVATAGRFFDGEAGCLWRVSSVDLANPRILYGVEVQVEVSERIKKEYPDSLYSTVITNVWQAEWTEGRWLFHGGMEQRFLPGGVPDGPPRGPLRGPVTTVGVTATPEDIAFGIDSAKAQKYVAASAILRWLHSKKVWSNENFMQSVDAHRRLAMPWACAIAVMLAIPAGVRGGRDGVIAGMLLALALFIGFYFSLEFFIVLGKKQVVASSWLGAWLANMVFFLVGTVMIRRVRN